MSERGFGFSDQLLSALRNTNSRPVDAGRPGGSLSVGIKVKLSLWMVPQQTLS